LIAAKPGQSGRIGRQSIRAALRSGNVQGQRNSTEGHRRAIQEIPARNLTIHPQFSVSRLKRHF
jgi:hypothetical protein